MTDAGRTPAGLDPTVRALAAELSGRGLPRPDALYLLATGSAFLADALEPVHELRLGELAGCPSGWRDATLLAGRLGPLTLWALDDLSGEPRFASPVPRWTACLSVWLARVAGARVCVHTSAGCALPRAPEAGAWPAAGSFVLVRDHLNLSGDSPLVGLGPSELGPLFPDQGRLHAPELRRAAAAWAAEHGLVSHEGVAACTAGPSLETPAERRMLARLGGDVCVQSLAAPLIACAHAGLACLSIVAVVLGAEEDEAMHVANLVERATATAPRLEELLRGLARDVAATAGALSDEEAP